MIDNQLCSRAVGDKLYFILSAAFNNFPSREIGVRHLQPQAWRPESMCDITAFKGEVHGISQLLLWTWFKTLAKTKTRAELWELIFSSVLRNEISKVKERPAVLQGRLLLREETQEARGSLKVGRKSCKVG